jgi:hypothetical protein
MAKTAMPRVPAWLNVDAILPGRDALFARAAELVAEVESAADDAARVGALAECVVILETVEAAVARACDALPPARPAWLAGVPAHSIRDPAYLLLSELLGFDALWDRVPRVWE